MIYELLQVQFDNGPTYYLNSAADNITILGQNWIGWPFGCSGYERRTDGTLPQPTITISDDNRFVSSALRVYTYGNVSRYIVDSELQGTPVALSYKISHWSMSGREVTITLLSPLESGLQMFPQGRISDL
jgi:hypothetical protein